jgi:hypothetical protein
VQCARTGRVARAQRFADLLRYSVGVVHWDSA